MSSTAGSGIHFGSPSINRRNDRLLAPIKRTNINSSFSDWYSPEVQRSSKDFSKSSPYSTWRRRHTSASSQRSTTVQDAHTNYVRRLLNGYSVGLVFDDTFLTSRLIYVGADIGRLENFSEELNNADTGYLKFKYFVQRSGFCFSNNNAKT